MTDHKRTYTWGPDPTDEIRYVYHESFRERNGAEWAAAWCEQVSEAEFGAGFMPDDETRASARRMHYAAHRAATARTARDAALWRRRYFATRDRIVLGNRKLIFRAVRQRMYQNPSNEDFIGECYLVMIRAVAAYNPWLGIRFSTYAYTCLLRALSRLARRSLADRLAQHLSIDSILGEEPAEAESTRSTAATLRLDEYLREEHPLLSDREKTVIRRRFRLMGPDADTTLESVGRDLGISKERVRQVQAGALDKLRQAILGTAPVG